jgi:phosphoglycolate phosphatase
MRAIDLMIFDFDGTLIDSGEDIAASVNFTMKELNLPLLDAANVFKLIGNGSERLIKEALGMKFEDRLSEAMRIFTNHYDIHKLDTTRLLPGVIEVLHHFRYKRKIIITNKNYETTRRIAEMLNISQFFAEIIGPDGQYKKPDSRILIPMLDRFSAQRNRTVVIGDGINDILLARNSGILSCAFLNGLTERKILLDLKPDLICEDLLELIGQFQ